MQNVKLRSMMTSYAGQSRPAIVLASVMRPGALL